MGRPIFPEEEYRIPFFVEEGFSRVKCEKCGDYFWTLSTQRKRCGEPPCDDYTFIGKPPTSKPYSMGEMREAFLSFFEKQGHKRISPYPVVARWRDDLYFTDASVVDFQPYVTNGIIPPPANPLVISQPCLRFVDIDHVGLTFGRHLTIFEMGGAHAFNYPDKEVYWKDGTVRFHQEFVVRGLGVKPEEVVYKEGVWSGGGNAGPDLECIIGGLEVATLVFMRFKVVNGGFVELPIRTVDTGYGMERFTWLSQGTVSCFHAVYGSTLNELLSMAGLPIDEKLLIDYAKVSGGLKLERVPDKRKLRTSVAKRLGMGADELHSLLEPLESVFAILDHSKSLAFMLAEGVVPSNVREGYLSRLVIRRLYRFLRSLSLEVGLPELVRMQVEYWSQDFPYLKEAEEEIVDLLSVEEEKYKRTLNRGRDLLKRVCSRVKEEGKSELSTNALVELYDSHGLPPSLVKEIAEREGVKAVVPDDFYGKVAARHLRAGPARPSVLEEKLSREVAGLSPTRALFYEDAYLREFTATVVKVTEGKYVVLDQTAFYAEAGGQLSDRGIMRWEGGECTVVNVQRVGNVLVHEVEGDVPLEGVKIHGAVDWDRRVSLMRHHTATHILLGALRRVLGKHAWQAGALKDVRKARLDVSHHKRITVEELREIEKLANKVVMENRPVSSMIVPRQEAEAKYGFTLYQGGVVPGKEVRVVNVEGWDVEACGGTHCSSTGEVGLIKIIGVDRIQDGVERLEFSAGIHAIEFVQQRESLIRSIARRYKVPIDKVSEAVDGLMLDWKLLRKKVEALTDEVIRYKIKEMLAESIKVNGVKLVVTSGKEEVDYFIKLCGKLVEFDSKVLAVAISSNANVRIVVMVGRDAIKQGFNAGRIANELAKIVGGRGGGKSDFGQGGGPRREKLGILLKKVKSVIVRAAP